MKKLLLFAVSILSAQFLFAQNYQEEFSKYFKEKDTVNQLKVLQNWEKENPKDPELYTHYFNYYLFKKRQEVLSLESGGNGKEGLAIVDSLKNQVGFIGSRVLYDSSDFDKAIHKINEGIKLYPNRLDMTFGKIHSLSEVENWRDFTDEIIKIVKYSSKNNNEWTWTNNEKVENGKDMLLSSIQSYQNMLFNTERDDLLLNMREISEEILKYYPNHIESLSNIAVSYMFAGKFDEGLPYLFKAEKINPDDIVILNNIAHIYKNINDKKNAIKYYEKAFSKANTEDDKVYFKEQIDLLKK
ncbi:tetratricopeptide repeat protein [Aureivirga sp. CE67]|uniref:tetratricopeptide repeat protein n=1 Tax=Aureivirga sp. CE67 TaxID=1788983 RepID=UPI0018C9E916|nr:tetratricopeptide repeat protein [Aureivirga sp. CE67]